MEANFSKIGDIIDETRIHCCVWEAESRGEASGSADWVEIISVVLRALETPMTGLTAAVIYGSNGFGMEAKKSVRGFKKRFRFRKVGNSPTSRDANLRSQRR